MQITITRINPATFAHHWTDVLTEQCPQWWYEDSSGNRNQVPRDTLDMLTLDPPIVALDYSSAYDQLLRKTPELIARQDSHDTNFERALFLNGVVENASARLLNSVGHEKGWLNEEDYDEDEWNALWVDHPADLRWAGQEWTAPCPLIAIREVYEDNDCEPPTGNVILVSGVNEKTWLHSLHLLGEIHMEVKED